MKKILLLVLSSMLFVTMYSQNGQNRTYPVSGGLLGAANLTQFRTDERVDYNSQLGWGLGGWLNLPLSNGFSIEPQLMYNSYLFKTTNTTSGLLLYDGRIGYVSLPILMKFHAGEYVAFTLGPQFDFMASMNDNDNVAIKNDFRGTSVGLSGGLEVFPHGMVTIFGRYIYGLTDLDKRSTHAASMDYKISNLQFGLKVRLFGKEEAAYQPPVVVAPVDTDGDGIADNLDKCPTVAGLARYNGCPIPDTDGDGINDELDKCPTVAGLAKYNGCPIPDTDGDGINDELDKCPTQAGPAKYNGCPIPDRDRDGINDEEDRCPDLAGVASNNGCPEVPANVSKFLGMAAGNISFGTGANNAKLTTKSYASLDKVVTIMNENPGLMIRVEGHTDNAGKADANQALSEDRAVAVKAYLQSKGISGDRITAEGFGGTQPIAENKTAAGRAKNRRIEIRMVY